MSRRHTRGINRADYMKKIVKSNDSSASSLFLHAEFLGKRKIWIPEGNGYHTDLFLSRCFFMSIDINSILKQTFGLESFREGQEDVVTSVVSGNDTLVFMPTGGGKSLTYQIPGIALPGIAIVISPLISLMKDQIDKLRER